MQGRGQPKSIYLGRYWRHLATFRPIITFPSHPPRPPGVQPFRGATLERHPTVPYHLSTCCRPFHSRLIDTFTSQLLSHLRFINRVIYVSIPLPLFHFHLHCVPFPSHFHSNGGRAGKPERFTVTFPSHARPNRSISVSFPFHLRVIWIGRVSLALHFRLISARAFHSRLISVSVRFISVSFTCHAGQMRYISVSFALLGWVRWNVNATGRLIDETKPPRAQAPGVARGRSGRG